MNRRDLLTTTGAVAALGLCAGIVAGAPGCTPAPAAEPIGAELAAAIERHRVALAAQEAAGRDHGAREQATIDRPGDAAALAAFAVADDAFNASCSREQDAHNAIIAVPIVTFADMRAKAAYLASVSGHIIHDGGTMAALLASMGGAAELSALTTEPDPLLALEQAYRKGLDDFNAGGEQTSEEDQADAVRTYRPHYDRLCSNPPPAKTLAGALAGIRLVLWEEETCGHHDGFTTNTLRAALAYFDRRA